MSSETSVNSSTPTRARGRGKSRGGLGKYLRARGRGRGSGRPAEFRQRLVLEDEELVEIDPESEEAKEQARKYSRRQLGSNADRYAEPEPVFNSDGEVEIEPEVDLSTFLARQRLDTESSSTPRVENDSDDVDTSLAHLSKPSATSKSNKGKVMQIEWDEELEEIRREKEAADANRDLKTRFRANAEKQKGRTTKVLLSTKERTKDTYVEAPPLPTEASPPSKGEKEQMEDFLDDLLG